MLGVQQQAGSPGEQLGKPECEPRLPKRCSHGSAEQSNGPSVVVLPQEMEGDLGAPKEEKVGSRR